MAPLKPGFGTLLRHPVIQAVRVPLSHSRTENTAIANTYLLYGFLLQCESQG